MFAPAEIRGAADAELLPWLLALQGLGLRFCAGIDALCGFSSNLSIPALLLQLSETSINRADGFYAEPHSSVVVQVEGFAECRSGPVSAGSDFFEQYVEFVLLHPWCPLISPLPCLIAAELGEVIKHDAEIKAPGVVVWQYPISVEVPEGHLQFSLSQVDDFDAWVLLAWSISPRNLAMISALL
jgi:hypothetical protein